MSHVHDPSDREDEWRARQLYPEPLADDERELEAPTVSGPRILAVGIGLGWLCGVWTAFVAWLIFA